MNQREVETLYDEHAEGLYRFLLSLVRHPHDARDLLQDIFVRIARSEGFLENKINVRAFLFKMARNAAIDRGRRLASRRRLDDSIKDQGSLFAPSADPDNETFRRKVAQALGELPEDQHDAVYLKLWEDLSFQEIAEVCSIPPATAASRYRYGIEKLRHQLDPIYREIIERKLRTIHPTSRAASPTSRSRNYPRTSARASLPMPAPRQRACAHSGTRRPVPF